MDKVSKAQRFIEAYNRLDQGIHEIYNLKRSIPFTDAIRQASSISTIIKKYQEELVSYARLRNAIIHNGNSNETIAEPNEEVVSKMENIARLVTTPPRVLDAITSRQVFSVSVSTKLETMISELYSSGYSVVPVYNKTMLVGVVNRKMIIDAIGKCVSNGKSVDAIMKLPVGEVLDVLDTTNHYEVVSSKITIDNMLFLFQQNRKLGVVIITKNGNYDEQPVGVVVASDTIEMQQILDKY